MSSTVQIAVLRCEYHFVQSNSSSVALTTTKCLRLVECKKEASFRDQCEITTRIGDLKPSVPSVLADFFDEVKLTHKAKSNSKRQFYGGP